MLKDNNLIAQIKNNISILNLCNAYNIDIKKSGKAYIAKVNPLREERTSSLYFYPDSNSFYDFGSREGGDQITLVCLLETCSIADAIRKLSKFYSIHQEFTTSPSIPALNNDYLPPEKVLSIFQCFQAIDISNTSHKFEIEAIVPLWVFNNANTDSLTRFKKMTRYDYSRSTLVVASFDEEDKVISFRHRKGPQAKWQARAKTPANKFSFTYITDDTNKPVFIMEGTHDALTATLLGINYIAIPSAGYRQFSTTILKKLHNRTCYLLPDIDDNGTGISCMNRLAKSIENISKDILICDIRFFLNEFSKNNDISKKIDFSDVVRMYNLPDFVEVFTNFCNVKLARYKERSGVYNENLQRF